MNKTAAARVRLAKTMKTILRLFALGFAALAGLSQTATAGHWEVGATIGTYVSGHSHCGCPVYTQRYFRGYDRCGHPLYGYRVLPVSHRCRPLVIVGPPRPICQPAIVPRPRGGSCGVPVPVPRGSWLHGTSCGKGGGKVVIAGIRFR